MRNHDAKRGYQVERASSYTVVSKSLSSVILRNLIGLEEIGLLGCRFRGRLDVPHQAQKTVSGTILSPGARVTDMVRL
jgi:hypothetical protein